MSESPHSSHRVVPARDAVRVLFRDRGLRCTRQREEIYLALHASCEHPTADELFHTVREGALQGEGGKGLSLATVYNTLEAFVQAGLCQRIPSPGNAGRYDADVREHAHVSTCDGQVLDLPVDLSEKVLSFIPADVLREVEQRTGVPIAGVQVQFLGGESCAD